MEKITEYTLELLNKYSVNLLVKEYIYLDGQKICIKNSSKAYCNCPKNRSELEEILPTEYWNAVVAVWTDEPLLEDLENTNKHI